MFPSASASGMWIRAGLSSLPTVSVVMPVFNEQEHVAEAIRSVAEQDYPDGLWEIIVVDGMSTDDTYAIVRDLSRKYSSVKLFRNTHRLIPHGLNIALGHAAGKIIVRVDGHSFVARDFLWQAVERLCSTGADCVGGTIETVGDSVMAKAIAMGQSHPFGVGNAKFRFSKKEEFVDTVAFGAYKREVFDRIGFYDERLPYNEDDELNFRLLQSGGQILLSPKIRVWYHSRPHLKGLWKQYFHYGRGKVRVLQKYHNLPSLRQIIPPLFAGSILTGSVVAVFSSTGLHLLAAILSLYAIANLTASSKVAAIWNWKYFFLLPAVFITMHVSYGLGFLRGISEILSPRTSSLSSRPMKK